MFAKERQYQIVELLRANGAVTVSDLVERFDVSIETVRRDLLQLEKQGSLQRVHGGAVLLGEMMSISKLPQRIEENKDGKAELCETAASFVSEGDILYIDNGATAVYFAQTLKQRFSKLTVVTNSQDVFNILGDKDGFDIILTGGNFMKEERAFYGFLTQETIKKLYVDKAFVIPSAISLQGGVCDFSHELAPIQHQIMEQCDKLYFLADSQKFERHGLLRLRGLDSSCVIITDSGISEELRRLYLEKGVQIIIGKEHDA